MLTIDYQSRLPIYEQLYHNVTRLVALGVYQPNDRLPTVRALAKELGINPNTIQKAYGMLERDSIIYTVTGKGSFISPDRSAVEQRAVVIQSRLYAPLRELSAAGFTQEEITKEIQRFFEKGGTLHD